MLLKLYIPDATYQKLYNKAYERGFHEVHNFIRAEVFRMAGEDAPPEPPAVPKLAAGPRLILETLRRQLPHTMTAQNLVASTRLSSPAVYMILARFLREQYITKEGVVQTGLRGSPSTSYKLSEAGNALITLVNTQAAQEAETAVLQSELRARELAEAAGVQSNDVEEQNEIAKVKIKFDAKRMQAENRRITFKWLQRLAIAKLGVTEQAEALADAQLTQADREVEGEGMTYEGFAEALYARVQAAGGPEAIQEKAERDMDEAIAITRDEREAAGLPSLHELTRMGDQSYVHDFA